MMYEILYCLINTLTLGLSHMIVFFATDIIGGEFKRFEQEVSIGVANGKYKIGWSDEYTLYEKLGIFEKKISKYLYIGSTIGLIFNTLTLGLGMWIVTIAKIISGDKSRGRVPSSLVEIMYEMAKAFELIKEA